MTWRTMQSQYLGSISIPKQRRPSKRHATVDVSSHSTARLCNESCEG